MNFKHLLICLVQTPFFILFRGVSLLLVTLAGDDDETIETVTNDFFKMWKGEFPYDRWIR